jgi:hemoglobin
MERYMKRWILVSALAALAACGAAPKHAGVGQAAKPAGTLYQQLGGKSGVERVIDAAMKHIHADPRVAKFFVDTDMREQRKLLVEQLCAASGGPCEYTGRSMEEAHSGLNLGDGDFEAFVSDIIVAMNEVKLPIDTQRQVLEIYWSMKPQVVGQ